MKKLRVAITSFEDRAQSNRTPSEAPSKSKAENATRGPQLCFSDEDYSAVVSCVVRQSSVGGAVGPVVAS